METTCDISILIVHYNTPELLRQTLLAILRAAPRVDYEVIVVDNNPHCRVGDVVRETMPDAKLVVSDENIGFGRGMNKAMEEARGRYFLVYNPDVLLQYGALENMMAFMDENEDVGMLGPKLCNPDGTLQHSCYRFMEPKTVLYRRLPLLSRMPFAREHVDRYLMKDWDHSHTRDVDYILGAVMFARREAVEDVGAFDSNYFVYFEEQDWCRRFWKNAWRVVYHPDVQMYHYHRRETAAGGFIEQLRNPLTRIQMKSALYYFRKFSGETNPRLGYQK